jgi:hypothetical protein
MAHHFICASLLFVYVLIACGCNSYIRLMSGARSLIQASLQQQQQHGPITTASDTADNNADNNGEAVVQDMVIDNNNTLLQELVAAYTASPAAAAAAARAHISTSSSSNGSARNGALRNGTVLASDSKEQEDVEVGKTELKTEPQSELTASEESGQKLGSAGERRRYCASW